MVDVSLSLLGGAGWQFFDDSGRILSAGRVYTYEAGGSTPALTYADSAGNTSNGVYVQLDSAGRPEAEIWLIQGQNYKFVVKEFVSTGVYADIRTYDNIPSAASSEALEAFIALIAGSTGSAQVGFQQAGAGATLRTAQAKMRERLTPQDFGAVGDGTTDDTAALNFFLAAVATGGEGHIPEGRYKFTSALTAITANNICLTGEGNGSLLLYAGVSTSPGNLITIGNGTDTVDSVILDSFRIDSSTVLTAGAALRLRSCRMNKINISIDGDDESDLTNCYDGVWLDTCTLTYLGNSRFTAQSTSVKWNNGTVLSCESLFIKGHLTAGEGTGIGILMAGGCGDLITGTTRQLFNDIGIRVDNSVSADPNNHIFVTPGSSFDVNKTAAMLVNDTSAVSISKSIIIEGELSSTTSGPGLSIASWNGDVFSSGGRFYNNGVNTAGSGIYCADTDTNLVIGPGAKIYGNYGYGIDAPAPWTINCQAVFMDDNVLGRFSTNVLNVGVAIAYDPTVSWGVDQTTLGAKALGAGGSIILSAGAGLVIVVNDSTGNSGVFHCYGGNVVKITGAGTIVAGAPGASEIGFQYSGGSYQVTNGYATTQNIYISTFRARPTS